jgi:2-polyprenyl-3-methyl-5-hydroxy-6-metoxy-1,4-benzoquinol methylase
MGENYNVNEEIGHTLPANTNTAHLWRYYIARGFVEPGDVVNDVACGYGYGSGILARTAAKEVRGFDYDKHALSDARKKFPKIHFVKQDLDTTHSLPPCDLSVTIETIEHLDDPDRFAETLRASTRRYIFVTTPFVPTTIEALGDEKGSPYHHTA